MGWLVLAAGYSKRFNGNKLLTCIGSDGRTLLELTLEKYQEQADPILVVTRSDQVLLHKLLNKLQVEYTISPVSHAGMGSSLAWGLSKVHESWAWVGVVLADMALVNPHTLNKLKCSILENNIVVPRLLLPSCQSSTLSSGATISRGYGHPVLFGSTFYSSLLELQGEVGARGVLQAYRDCIVEVATEDCGVVFDVDSRLDMRKMAEMLCDN